MKRAVSISFYLLLSLCHSISLAVNMPPVFADGMVLQRNSEVSFWGDADPNERIIINASWSEKSFATVADNHGAWRINVATTSEGGPYSVTVSGSKDMISIDDVLLGEVWLCSGQSNMAFRILIMQDYEEELKNFNYPEVRLYSSGRGAATYPKKEIRGEWISLDRATPEHSAIPALFGRELYIRLGVPIGILNVSYPGSSNEAWLPEDQIADLDKPMAILEEARNGADKWGGSIPSGLFNAMLNPVIPYGIRGVAWYQGEDNASHPSTYHLLLSRLISSWRELFNNRKLPFIICQLSGYQSQFDMRWVAIQEIQGKIQDEFEGVYTIPTYDIGLPDNIHPKNKQEVVRRMVSVTESEVYGHRRRDALPPVIKQIKKGRSSIRLSFSNATEWKKTEDADLHNFEIAGKDGIFKPANARIAGRKKVVVWNEDIEDPQDVRYAFKPFNADVNFFNSNSMPVLPFRTDNYPLY